MVDTFTIDTALTSVTPTRRRQTPLRRWAAVGVTVVLSLTILVLGTLVGARLLGHDLLLVQSGSMGDAVPVGSLVVTRDIARDAIQAGDVVVLDPPGAVASRTHRVIQVRTSHGREEVRTRGDANPTADAGWHALPPRVPTPMFVLPGVGYVVAAATGRGGLLVLASLIALVLAFGGLRLLWHEA